MHHLVLVAYCYLHSIQPAPVFLWPTRSRLLYDYWVNKTDHPSTYLLCGGVTGIMHGVLCIYMTINPVYSLHYDLWVWL